MHAGNKNSANFFTLKKNFLKACYKALRIVFLWEFSLKDPIMHSHNSMNVYFASGQQSVKAAPIFGCYLLVLFAHNETSLDKQQTK